MTFPRRTAEDRVTSQTPVSVAARRHRWPLLADRDARLYISGQIVSMVGDSSLWLAIGIWVKALTGSSSQAALVWCAFIVGGMTGPFSSVLVDRLPLRPVLIVTNLVSAVDVLLLLLVHSGGSAWLTYPVMFGYGFTYALLNAGSSAVVRPLFGADLLASANATLTTAKQSMNLVAPLLGAGLFAVVGATPVIVADAVSFLVAAAAMGLVRTRIPRAVDPSAERPGAWVVLSAGMRHIMRTPPLRRVVLAVSVAILGLGFLEPVEFDVNSQGLHHSPAFMGLLFGFQGVGALVGGVFSARAIRAGGEMRTGAAGLAAASAGIAAMAATVLPIVLLGFAVYGAALTWVSVAQQTQLQRRTPAHTQGRAAGAASLLTKTPQAVGIAAGSALISVTGYLPLLAIIALLTGSAATWLFAARDADQAEPAQVETA